MSHDSVPRRRVAVRHVLLLGALLLVPLSDARADTRCVDPSGRGGCKKTISAAVAAASAGDVIRVARGVYHETVTVTIPLSLIGEGPDDSVIDATNLLNAINVDGLHHPGLAHVIITGFQVRNANAQGIVVTNASDVTISNNLATGNDRALDVENLMCPGIPPYFEAGEGFDCGEGIHLSGVDHSIVSRNVVRRNAGGILISDDTGPNHDNLISENLVEDNPYDCGITLASHHFNLGPTDPSLGIYHITVIGNTSRRNGLKTGEGAGVGLFTGPPGGQNNGNVVAQNVLTDNALPGVAIHTHAPFQSNNNHVIIGNVISGNGPDEDPGTTVRTGISIFSPVVPMTGIVIAQNVFTREGIDIGINMTDPTSTVDAHFNSFSGDIGIDNLGAGTISATANWWDCVRGPGARGCASVEGSGVTTTPVLTQPYVDADHDDHDHDHHDH